MNKWFFELWLSDMGGGEGISLGQFGPWETERLAISELSRATRLACEAIEKSIDGQTSGKYIDMKTNELRSWDEH